MREYMLMIWDGLGFFGFDNAKLGRLKGEPVTFTSKYKEPTKLSISIMMIIFVVYIILSQVAKIGKQKDQQVQLVMKQLYLYPIKEALTLLIVNQWFVAEIFPLVQQF